MVEFKVSVRWPDWHKGDVGAYVRQCLQFSLHGRMPPLAVHDNGLRASWEGDDAEGRALIQEAVRYANKNTAKVFPSMYRDHGPIFGAVQVEEGGL